MAGVVQTSLDGWEQRARRWLVEVFGGKRERTVDRLRGFLAGAV